MVDSIPSYRRSARRDVRIWLMLAVAAAFFAAGSLVDPAANCSADGRECAPWLIPVAWAAGVLLGLSAAAMLIANPQRGSMIDSATGDLVWWQRRIGARGGDEGRIHPSRISRIRIVRHSDSADAVHLYDREGARLFWFDEEVIPWPCDRWAAKLAAAWPHIVVEVTGD